MHKRIKRFLYDNVELYRYLHSIIGKSKIKKGSTILIHIGKCGGRTIRDGLSSATKNQVDYEVHIKKPVYRRDLKYIIVARGVLSRLDSAFRWRYKLVVTDAIQRNRFKGEYEVLVKYKSLNSIAEALYDDNGIANKEAQEDIKKIHHIKEDISFYLTDLLNRCDPNQIVAVLMQENLDNDIKRVFGYENRLKKHINSSANHSLNLSKKAKENLMRFFIKDYEALMKLYCWNKIEKDIFKKALDDK